MSSVELKEIAKSNIYIYNRLVIKIVKYMAIEMINGYGDISKQAMTWLSKMYYL